MRTAIRRAGTRTAWPVLLLSVAACSDFVAPPESDPNTVPDATVNQLFVAAQATLFFWHGGFPSQINALWMQQMGGTSRQHVNFELYDVNEGDFAPIWDGAYQGGGLIDLKKAIDMAEENGWIGYGGVLKLHLAYWAGMLASFLGDIPFSEALQPAEFPQPALDPQTDVYADVQQLLSEAISDMSNGSGASPGVNDFNFGGDYDRWIAVAHTLKARFHLHWVEVEGNGRYTQALSEAEQGIMSVLGNWTQIHSTNTVERNAWWRDDGADDRMRSNDFIVSMMNNGTPGNLEDDEPRASVYWRLATGDFTGQRIGHRTGATEGDPGVSASWINVPGEMEYPLPIATCSETYLIIAEANAALGSEAAARAALEDALGCQEQWWGVDLSELKDRAGGLAGEALFEEIMKQKFIGLFLELETWNDYKRTCLPARVPAPGHSAIPGRWLYSVNERQTNENVPPPEEQPDRNDNDPAPCTS
ncbi:MAG: SusD/RagB family nutrient-binding outer membrane lipoprotein [Gemmatimonadales bacterium]